MARFAKPEQARQFTVSYGIMPDDTAVRILDEWWRAEPADVLTRHALRRWEAVWRPMPSSSLTASAPCVRPFWIFNRDCLAQNLVTEAAEIASATREMLALHPLPKAKIRADALMCLPKNSGLALVWNTGRDIADRLEFPTKLLPDVAGELWPERAMVVLHAAAASIDGQGVLLLAPSGGGKSTTARTIDAQGGLGLSEDAVALHWHTGTDAPPMAEALPSISALPPFGVLGDNLFVYRPEVAVPLRLIAVIRKADTDATRPISTVPLLTELTAAARIAHRQWVPAERAHRMVARIGELARTIPSVELHARQAGAVVSVLRRALSGVSR